MTIDNRVCCHMCPVQQGAWVFAGLEMVTLVLGVTGTAMILGWTQGIGLSQQNGYTPTWACIVLMVVLSVLVLSLILAMLGMRFQRSGLIMPHILLLLFSWVVAFLVCIASTVFGGPILTAVFIMLYFTVILGFGWTLYQFRKWTTTIGHR